MAVYSIDFLFPDPKAQQIVPIGAVQPENQSAAEDLFRSLKEAGEKIVKAPFHADFVVVDFSGARTVVDEVPVALETLYKVLGEFPPEVIEAFNAGRMPARSRAYH